MGEIVVFQLHIGRAVFLRLGLGIESLKEVDDLRNEISRLYSEIDDLKKKVDHL